MSKRYDYPDKLEIKPLDRPVNATIRVPGSKSITNRALVLAALACRNGPCKITGMLDAEDTHLMIAALRQLGFVIALEEGPSGLDATVTTTNPLVHIPARTADLYCGNSGTTMRFLTAMVALGHGEYRLDGDGRMRERPIEDLLDGLRQLGVDAKTERDNECPPVVVKSNGVSGGTISISGNVSSQFVSGLMMAVAFAHSKVEIEVVGDMVSSPYVQTTLAMLIELKIKIRSKGYTHFVLTGDQQNVWKDYAIEPDATAASYFFAAAGICLGNVEVDGLPIAFILSKPSRMVCSPGLQGDGCFVSILDSMGCRLGDGRCGIRGGPLYGIDADMNAISDTVPTLAAVACFAEGPTTIRNVAHIRHKECDRINALCTELRKLGVEAEEYPDGLKITPRPMHGAEIETYNDHRIAMSMALIGLKVPGVVIKNPGCVAKTYPGYWEDFEKLYQ
jgi:3-phosphoshikimate 1-carboxyvinyltransferase